MNKEKIGFGFLGVCVLLFAIFIMFFTIDVAFPKEVSLVKEMKLYPIAENVSIIVQEFSFTDKNVLKVVYVEETEEGMMFKSDTIENENVLFKEADTNKIMREAYIIVYKGRISNTEIRNATKKVVYTFPHGTIIVDDTVGLKIGCN